MLIKLAVVFLSLLALNLGGCGSDGGKPPPVTEVVFRDGATVSVVDSGNGAYTIQGGLLPGVTGIEINLTYDSSTMSSPSVVPGDLVSGFMNAINTQTPGVIRMAYVGTAAVTGDGPICSISFSLLPGETGRLSLHRVNMIDSNGRPL